jgi:chromatin remodeling complex protein RSC6
MPRVKNSETASTATASTTPVPSTTAPASATPKVVKAPKTEKTSSATTAPSTTPSTVPATPKKVKTVKATAVAPATASSASTTTPVEATAQEVSTPSEFTDFMSKLQQLSNMINSLKSEFRTLEKKANKDLKTVAKANLKKKKKNVNRAPSGFVKPTLISSELATFLGKSAGTEMARTDVTREINAYIRLNKLQNESNGRIINADAKLSSLLKIPAGEELTYFNLQRYMSPHFTKTTPAVATA